ncbi:MAG: fumarylacetoacetate hydrolase family protein [bacterium]|nr:fumarylacetoacetate hydrolase family protein [bacterium]
MTTQLTCSKAVCVARNWRGHIRELGNETPQEPVFFIKPTSCLTPLEAPIRLPGYSHEVHYEVELALLVSKPLSNASLAEAREAVSAVAIALDLTARDIQTQLKAKGLPWEKAKCFDGALPLGPWIGLNQAGPLGDLELQLDQNGQRRQTGRIDGMIHQPFELLSEASRYFSFAPGDLLLCGTPEGVGPLQHGDLLSLSLSGRWTYQTRVL